MRRHFDAAGTLSRGLPGFEPRAEQLALATAVERALGSGEHLLAEAGTGTGKSLAYLVPALESGLRVVVATATKALQEQLLVHDVPAAAVALGRDVDAAILKGRENYLCRRSLDGLEVLGSRGSGPGSSRPRPATGRSSTSSRGRCCGRSSPSARIGAVAHAARSPARASRRPRVRARRRPSWW
jgi:Rad3-related DNA helicase